MALVTSHVCCLAPMVTSPTDSLPLCGTVWHWDCPSDIILFPTWFSAWLPCSALVHNATWWHKIILGNSGVCEWLKDLTYLHFSDLHIRSESISVSKGKLAPWDPTLSNVWTTSHHPLSETFSECCHTSLLVLLSQFVTSMPPSLSGL